VLLIFAESNRFLGFCANSAKKNSPLVPTRQTIFRSFGHWRVIKKSLLYVFVTSFCTSFLFSAKRFDPRFTREQNQNKRQQTANLYFILISLKHKLQTKFTIIQEMGILSLLKLTKRNLN
jgi:hypothetical protein